MKILVEDFNEYHIGDIIKIRRGSFKRFPGKELIQTGHMFVIISQDGIVCEISSQNKVNEKFPWNIKIQDWKSAGLNKESHVKTDTSGRIADDSSVYELIGHLSESDLNNVLASYKNAPQNYKLEWIQ